MSFKVDNLEYWVQRTLPLVYEDSMSYYELLNKVIMKLNEVIEKSNDYFSKDLKAFVAEILQGWYDDGTLEQIINDEVFKNKLNVTDFNRFVGLHVDLKGDGSDETAKIQAAVDTLGALGGGRLIFPRGSFVFNNVVIPNRVFFAVKGQGDRHTVLKNTTGQLFIVGGIQNTDSFEISDVQIVSTNDNDYDKPLIDLKYVRNVKVNNLTSVLSGTGTLFGLDTTYVFNATNLMVRTGRYAVAFDMTNLTNPSEQQDTFRFENVVIFGNLGVIQRRTGGNYHGNIFDGLKVLNLVADGDFNAYVETTTTVTQAKGGTVLDVASTGGFAIGQPIVIDYGEKVELNRVSGIDVGKLLLAKPLMYAHNSGAQIINSGVCVSLSNPFNTLFTGCHFEGHPVGIMVDSGKGLDFISNYSGVGEFIRICGGAQDFTIGTTIMDGTDRNIAVKVPTWNTNTALTRIRMNGPFVRPSGSPTVVVQEGFDKNIPYVANNLVTGVNETLINMSAGQGTLWKERVVVNAAEQFKQSYDGELRWRDQVSLDYIRENTAGVRNGGHLYVEGKWDGGTLAMGGYHLWVDVSNRLRIKYGLPTSDLDGAVIGSQS